PAQPHDHFNCYSTLGTEQLCPEPLEAGPEAARVLFLDLSDEVADSSRPDIEGIADLPPRQAGQLSSEVDRRHLVLPPAAAREALDWNPELLGHRAPNLVQTDVPWTPLGKRNLL